MKEICFLICNMWKIILIAASLSRKDYITHTNFLSFWHTLSAFFTFFCTQACFGPFLIYTTGDILIRFELISCKHKISQAVVKKPD